MSIYGLRKLFSPQSVALVGASPQAGSLGFAVLHNLRNAGFQGDVHLVNPRYDRIGEASVVASLEDLPKVPDLVVIVAPPSAVPGIVAQAGERGSAGAVIITAGLGHGQGSLAEAAEQASRRKGLRLIGPNCLGIMVPRAKLNASFAAHMPAAGDLALISQSGAIAAGMVDWAAQRAVGFSAVVSIGDQLDVDIGDLLDYFALDPGTRAILLYVESIKDSRKFMSAARAAARSKPVVVVKSGRLAQGAKAAATHTGALAGSDAVYDAAFHRAGLLRVLDLGELFEAAEVLSRIRDTKGSRLAILTNGGGIGVLAVDRLVELGGEAARISEATLTTLNAALPPNWSKANPVDIIGDAGPPRYRAALEALLDDHENDATLVLNVQTAVASSLDAARCVADVVKAKRGRAGAAKPVLAVWVGADAEVASIFNDAGIPRFESEGEAVRGFMHLVRHRSALQAAMEAPPSLPTDFTPNIAAAKAIVNDVLADGRTWLDPLEVTKLFEAYAIPTLTTWLARDPDEAEATAATLIARGEAVVLKILSRDIIHKSDVGGVRLNLTSADAVRTAAAELLAAARAARPDARIGGITVQPMVIRPKARELIAGIADDPTFGPIILFGRGGTAVEVIDDKALALPPLDLRLAQDLISRTRVSRILGGYRNVPAVEEDAVALVLVKIAQLAADLPEVRELDINPLLADETGVLSLDARVKVDAVEPRTRGSGHPRMAIRPYPTEQERSLVLGDGWRVFVRPVRPNDEERFRIFFTHVSPQDLRLRFFATMKGFDHPFIARLTQLDYARSMAFIAIDEKTEDMLGVVRLHADANYESGEYAILLRSDLKGCGLGWALMELMIAYARSEGLRRVEGQVLQENSVMMKMCRELGFQVQEDPDDAAVSFVTLELERPDSV